MVCRVVNVTDQVFACVKEMLNEALASGDSDKGERSLAIADVIERCTAKGFRPGDIEECLEEYEDLNIWQINSARTRLMFI